jgi:hypothetical protein
VWLWRASSSLLAPVLVIGLLATPALADDAPAAGDAVLSNTLGSGEPIVGTDISSLGGQQYHQNNQRNVWWNEDKRRWDGILPTASPPAANPSAWWLWQGLDTEPTPSRVMESATARTPDALWDADERLLYVFFSRGNSGTSKFRRYRYDPMTDRYDEDSVSGGVNAPTRLRGGKRVTIVKSPNGYLWAGVNSGESNEILVSRSTDGGDTWPEPVRIKATDISGEGHWVTFTQDGTTRVGFAATEDGAAPGGEARVHFLHLDEDEADWTDPTRWTDETSQLPGWEGDERADDELSAVVFEDRVFVTIETEPLGDARSNRRPQLIVFERHAGGGWAKHVILRYLKFADDAKRPVITVDASARLLIVSAGSTQRTHADLWYAPIDSLDGRDERWSKLRVFEVGDSHTESIYTTRMPLPRYPVVAGANLPVLIDDRGDAKRMWRQVVRSDGGGGDPDDPNRPPVIDAVTIDQPEPRTDDTLTVTVTASDPDGDPLSFSYRWVKDGTVLEGRTASTLELSEAGNGDKGDRIAVQVTASDGRASSEPVTSDEVTVVNSPPVFDQDLPDRASRVGESVSFSAVASDPDGDPLTYTASGLPPEVAIDPATGAIAGTITQDAEGQYRVSVTVSDGTAEVVDSFTWSITLAPVPQAPADLTAAASSTEVVLRWVDSSEPDLVGYHVYRAAETTGPYNRLSPTPVTAATYTDATAPAGASFYRVTAVHTGGVESAPAEVAVADRIVLRSVSEGTVRDGRTLSIPPPAGTAVDDVLVATIAVNGTGTITAPAAWTLIREDTNGSDMRQATYHRVATSSEPSSYAFTLSANSSATGVALSYVGVDTSSPVDVADGRANPSSTSLTAPALTTTGPNRLLTGTFSVASNANNGVEPPPEMVERADVFQGQGPRKIALEAADEIVPAAGVTGPRTATTSRPGANVGHLVALRPSGR